MHCHSSRRHEVSKAIPRGSKTLTPVIPDLNSNPRIMHGVCLMTSWSRVVRVDVFLFITLRISEAWSKYSCHRVIQTSHNCLPAALPESTVALVLLIHRGSCLTRALCLSLVLQKGHACHQGLTATLAPPLLTARSAEAPGVWPGQQSLPSQRVERAGLEEAQPGLEPAPIWDASTADTGLILCATAPALGILKLQ